MVSQRGKTSAKDEGEVKSTLSNHESRPTRRCWFSNTKGTMLYILRFCTVLFLFLTIFYKKMFLSKALSIVNARNVLVWRKFDL